MGQVDLGTWHASGQHRRVLDVDGIDRQLFTRVVGEGPWTTFWHGYPSSSWDWAKIDPLLDKDRARLYLDHLGFGASEEPGDHAYSLLEQVDLACQVWEQLGVEETLLVAHDYSVSIVQELLDRQQAGRWDGPKLTGILLMNGGRGAMHRVSQYYDEREAYEERWTQALSQAKVPLHLVWGLEDPVSGRGMFERTPEATNDPGSR